MNELQSTKSKAKWPVSRIVWFSLGMSVFAATLIFASMTVARVVNQQQELNDDARMRIMDEGMSLQFSPFPLPSPLSGRILNLELLRAKDSLNLEVEIVLVDSLESKLALDTVYFHSDTLLSEGVILTDTLFCPEMAERRTNHCQFTIVELRSADATLEAPPREMPFPSRPEKVLQLHGIRLLVKLASRPRPPKTHTRSRKSAANSTGRPRPASSRARFSNSWRHSYGCGHSRSTGRRSCSNRRN
jgi:hypothetical protein